MVKFLFTSERLSIQVHPDDEAARGGRFPRGKEECWLVLSAEPDAELGVGLNVETTPEAIRDAALDGSIVGMSRLAAVEGKMISSITPQARSMRSAAG